MKSITKNWVYLIAFLLITTAGFSQDKETKLEDKEKWELVEMQGTITEINKETREISIIGSKGELHTVTAGEEVERFDDIEVGDVITFDFYKYMKAEFRNPTEEELENPLVIVTEEAKAPADLKPGAALGAIVQAVVTIQVINLPFMYVNIEGPNGNFTTIHMKDKELIQKLHVGQVVILTYAEAMAITLEKVE
ncbi:hypothetical protein [Xanthomarina spongicola]|uniref:Uncharacterized protein n=1 Tax=Xanthomarina spongicola TaxID=570520 RepID=A0A316DM97_9FLAO|nr:hypothetical protein [Xanthomarina spongicola]PWK18672.1 hypothetical protein LX78_01979 [Xanthomarina spongicola]